MAALKDIAVATGVSIGTVSRILNQGRAHLYNPETCKRVVEASQRLKYRPNRSAQAMRLQKTRTVGFAAMNMDSQGILQNYSVYPFITGLSLRLAKANYHVALVECTEMGDADQPDEPWSIQERFLDAIVVHYGFNDRAMRFAENVGVPLTWWDSGVFSTHNSVYRDEIAVAREVTRRMIELGHTRIGYVTNSDIWNRYTTGRFSTLHYSYINRYETYRDEMRSHGLREIPIVHDMHDVGAIARQLEEHKITAAIASAHELAIFAGAQQLGWRIPQDVSVVTMDREARMDIHGPRIAGMLYDRFGLGEQTAEMVLTMLEDGRAKAPSIRYVGDFDMGDTLAPPRHG